MDLKNAIIQRHSVRSYTDKKNRRRREGKASGFYG